MGKDGPKNANDSQDNADGQSADPAPEVWFYHLERQRLEDVLPSLLEKTRARGWRAVVQAGNDERCSALNDLLWTYSQSSFLAHGTIHDGNPETQPVFLTTDQETPNAAEVRFLVDGAEAGDLTAFTRSIFLFDGHDDQAVADARTTWKSAKEAGGEVTYWQQSPQGKWEKKA